MLRPTFEKQQITDLDQFERHMQAFFAAVPKDGSTVDLQALFHQLSMDASTELLTGTSTHSLSGQNKEAVQFVEDFECALQDCSTRSQWGWLYYLVPHFKSQKAIRGCKRFVQQYVDQALAVKAGMSGEKGGEREGKFVFLNELAKHEEVDAERIRNETLNILLAGRDTTASLLSHLFFVLSKRQDVWEKLQKEVDELGGEVPGYEYLRNMKYLKYAVQESTSPPCPFPMLYLMPQH